MQAGMVHALREIHRILKPRGTLIDLRPHSTNRQVLVELSYATLNAGEIDSSRSVADRLAADHVIEQAVKDKLFTLEHHTHFELYTDLDTVDDLREYGKSFNRSVLPEAVIQQVERLTHDENDDFSIRVQRPFTIARYRKL